MMGAGGAEERRGKQAGPCELRVAPTRGGGGRFWLSVGTVQCVCVWRCL